MFSFGPPWKPSQKFSDVFWNFINDTANLWGFQPGTLSEKYSIFLRIFHNFQDYLFVLDTREKLQIDSSGSEISFFQVQM